MPVPMMRRVGATGLLQRLKRELEGLALGLGTDREAAVVEVTADLPPEMPAAKNDIAAVRRVGSGIAALKVGVASG